MLLLSLSSSVVSYIAPTNLQRVDACVIPMYGHAPFPVILGLDLISRVTLLFTLQCQAAIVHRGPLHFTMVEVAENHHRIEAQDQNFRLVH